jgi:antitoxin component of MazEF toxin-antitoxin module
MAQKIIKVGSSAAVTLSRDVMERFGWHLGDPVSVMPDEKRTVAHIVPIAPRRQNHRTSARQRRIAELTLDFINRYRADLEALART